MYFYQSEFKRIQLSRIVSYFWSPNDAVWNITLIICCFWKYLLEYYKTWVSIETFFSLSEVNKIMLNKFIWFIRIFLTIQQNSKLFNILIIALSHNAKNYAFESNKLLVKNHNQGHSALATERHGSYLYMLVLMTSFCHLKDEHLSRKGPSDQWYTE